MRRTTTIVACCQVPLSVDNPKGNSARLTDAIVSAAGQGAQVIVLPELANSGYMFNSFEELQAAAEPLDGPTVLGWIKLAAELNVIIVGGFAEAGADGFVYNSAALIDPSGLRTSYRKAHLWNHEKDGLFTPGSGLPPVVETTVGRIGVMICYDLEFPEWVRSVALRGADILCAPVNWPLYPRPAGERSSEVFRVQAGASVNRMFIAACDRVGMERGQDWLGGSVIVDADGFPQASAPVGREGIALASLELSQARSKSISERNDVHRDRRTDLYRWEDPGQH